MANKKSTIQSKLYCLRVDSIGKAYLYKQTKPGFPLFEDGGKPIFIKFGVVGVEDMNLCLVEQLE